MSFQINLVSHDRQFTCSAHQTVLEAALQAGIVLPYGCKNGACGSCKGEIVSGEVTYPELSPQALSVEDQAQNKALFCCAVPKTDISIDATVVKDTSHLAVKRLPARIQKLERLTEDVIVMHLQLPAQERLEYFPGQYIDFLLKDGKRRSYSIANAPREDNVLTFHIRHMPGGNFTDYLFTGMKEREIMRVEGPLGTFFLHEQSEQPIILLASGTGFAPIKAIVEYALQKAIKRSMVLYWGVRRPADLYMHDLCLQWQQEHAHFSYVPVVSDALPEEGWQGRDGFVHHAVLDDFARLSEYEVYACGLPLMVSSAQQDFVAQRQLVPEHFYSDAFVSTADLIKNKTKES